HQNRHQRAPDVQQEHDADERHDQTLLDQRVPERLDGGIDQIGAIVDRNNLDRLRQAGRDLVESLFHVVDDVERVDAEALQYDAAGNFAFTVEFGDTTPFVGAEFHARDVAQQHRCTPVGLEYDVAEVIDALQIPAAADDIFELRELHCPSADVGIT